ncbi:hypothetical protein ABBQ32_007021 [Trebouxia sp. C0010 RCD-2024]
MCNIIPAWAAANPIDEKYAKPSRGPSSVPSQRQARLKRVFCCKAPTTIEVDRHMGQTAADQLRQIVLPDLVRLVGDVKLQRVSADGVVAYLHRQQLSFDEHLLRNMFDEADFKHEGSLGVGPLTGAIQGRFPKRRHGQADWLALVSVILRRPLQELQNLLAPATSKSVRFVTAKSMEVATSTQGLVTGGLKQAKQNPAFTKKAPQGEWQALIRATSHLQPTTGSLPRDPMATTSATAAASHQVPPMRDVTAVAAAPTSCDRSGDDMNATAMSIDTPSYARSLGMGQPGSAAGFAGSPFHMSLDLAQAMSIDGHQTDYAPGHSAVGIGTGQHSNCALKM